MQRRNKAKMTVWKEVYWKIMFNFGNDPLFQHCSQLNQLETLLISGVRPDLSCRIRSASFIRRCWEVNPNERPTLEEGLAMTNNDIQPKGNSYS